MAKFLIEATYGADGVSGIRSAGGSSRRDAVAKALEGVRRVARELPLRFGDSDAYVIVDAPDNVTAAAVTLTVNATGVVRAKTIVLLTPEEVDAAAKKSVSYTPPGG